MARAQMPLSLPKDPALVPAYSVAQVARYLKVPDTTIAYWVSPDSGPLIIAPWQEPPFLCFKNIVECHVLHALRKRHHLKMSQIRSAILTLRHKWSTRYALADKQLSTDEICLFLQEGRATYNVSREGEQVFDFVLPYLERIERDPLNDAPLRLYPFLLRAPVAGVPREDDRPVVIDPRVCFGRAVLSGSRISTEVIAGRIRAGDSVAMLASQYARTPKEIQAAVQFEASPSAP